MKHEQKIAKVSTIIVFLALIRTTAEPIRLSVNKSISPLLFEEAFPYILGALVAAIGLFIITILSYFGKHKLIILASLLVIAGLVAIKFQLNIK